MTGGSSGIGKQLASDLLRLGASVVVSSDDVKRVEQAVSDLSAISPRVAGLTCDVGASTSVLGMAGRMLNEHGSPDILINNPDSQRTELLPAVTSRRSSVSSRSTSSGRSVLQGRFPGMIRRGSGVIVNMSSIAGRLIITPNGSYCASKHALVAWSEVLRYELAHYGLRVHAMYRGSRQPSSTTRRFEPGRLDERPAIRPRSRTSRAPRLITIQRNRFLTYVPWNFGRLVWLMNTLPGLVKPVYGKLLLDRLHAVYQQEEDKLTSMKETDVESTSQSPRCPVCGTLPTSTVTKPLGTTSAAQRATRYF